MPEPWQIALTVAAGFVTGMLSGMFGIGGAVVSNPALRALGLPPIEAVGSTLPSILPSAISGSLRYHRAGLLHVGVIRWTGLSGAVAAVGGSLLSDQVPGDGHLLTLTIAALMAFTALRLLRTPKRTDDEAPEDEAEMAVPPDGEGEPDTSTGAGVTGGADTAVRAVARPPANAVWWRLVIIGLVAGLASGLLGIGGGLLMVPLFTGWLKMPLKETLGTSLACVGLLAIPGMITHTILGHTDWGFALPLAVGVIPGAQLGAKIAIGAAEQRLRVIVAVGLATIAVVYGVNELLSMLS